MNRSHDRRPNLQAPLEGGQLGFQRCSGLRAAVFYPLVLCPVCGTRSRVGGQFGTGLRPTLLRPVQADAEPYNVVLVDLRRFSDYSALEGVPPRVSGWDGGGLR